MRMVRLGVQTGNLFRQSFCELLLFAADVSRRSRYAPEYNIAVNFKLRDFRPEDLETLWKIDQRCFAEGISYSKVELKTYIERRGSLTLVAESSDRGAVGFIVFEGSQRGIGHIITIDVLPEARRFGVGSKLLNTAEQRLRAENCHALFLETAVDNKPALAFYKRHGYFLVKTHPRYYGNGLDAFVLKKELTSETKLKAGRPRSIND